MITSVATKGFFGKLADKKKGQQPVQRIFWGKKAQSTHIWRKKRVELARPFVLVCHQYMPRFAKTNLLFSPTSSQIWRSPLLEITGLPASQNWGKSSPLAPPHPPPKKQKPDKRPT
jgi:hypothetical protein